ncbi:hypothetical protein DM48_324 [Burkholderia gladioli]|uniref:Phage ABA sandwich domain-containing protein n=1 Tax=Burkholderia gladioli TaxID=28095 RepID=A0AAW3EVJ7_BURGA|nr:hypothetical protein [Burkholderia gladioli]KGC12919.1 hypothetical protein DM48_324 [Burkholderia gladioli]
MNDRELLELAAKAAGLDLRWNEFWKGMYRLSADKVKGEHWDANSLWNPLADDGDALRLAVKLNLIVGAYGSYASVGETYDKQKLAPDVAEFICWHHETRGDQCAALRRAITRAAAEIGKNMGAA